MYALQFESSIELVEKLRDSAWQSGLSDEPRAKATQLQAGHRATVVVSGHTVTVTQLAARVALYHGSGAFEPMSTVLNHINRIAGPLQYRQGWPLLKELAVI